MTKGYGNPFTQYQNLIGMLRQSHLNFSNEKKESSQGFNRNLTTEMNERLKEYNSRNTEQVNQHLEAIKNAITSDIEGSIDLKYGGSVYKTNIRKWA